PGEALSGPFWMLSCGECGSWRRFDEPPKEGDCDSCGSALDPERARECRTPNGSRTDFSPQPIEGQELATGRYRSICAEGKRVHLDPAIPSATNFRVACHHQPRTYRLNRGPRTDANPLGEGFDLAPGSWRLGRYTQMNNQLIAMNKDNTPLTPACTRDFDR